MKEAYQLPAYYFLGYGWKNSAQEEQVKLGRKREREAQIENPKVRYPRQGREVTLLDVSRPTAIGQYTIFAGHRLFLKGLEQGNAPALIFAGEPPLHDHGETSADVNEHQFNLINRNYPDPTIIKARGLANTTSTELDRAFEAAVENDIDHFGVVAYGPHVLRTRLTAWRKRLERKLRVKPDVSVTVVDAKKVLSDPQMYTDSQRITSEEKAQRHSRYHRKLVKTKGHLKLLANEIVTTPVELLIGHKLTDRLAARGLRLKVMSS